MIPVGSSGGGRSVGAPWSLPVDLAHRSLSCDFRARKAEIYRFAAGTGACAASPQSYGLWLQSPDKSMAEAAPSLHSLKGTIQRCRCVWRPQWFPIKEWDICRKRYAYPLLQPSHWAIVNHSVSFLFGIRNNVWPTALNITPHWLYSCVCSYIFIHHCVFYSLFIYAFHIIFSNFPSSCLGFLLFSVIDSQLLLCGSLKYTLLSFIVFPGEY